MVYDSIPMKLSGIGKSIPREHVSVVSRGWVEREMGNACLIGMELPFWVMQVFWSWLEVFVA